MAATIEDLYEAIRTSARSSAFPVDAEVYERFHKDPCQPILHAGALDAPVCIFGRDLGKDEVRLGQPLIGAGGKLVRQGLQQSFEAETAPTSNADLLAPPRHALLTNTVPYKPPGNKAYSAAVKERFRPFVIELLTHFWSGSHIITLGTEAFQWFEPYGDPQAFSALGRTDERFESIFDCRLTTARDDARDDSGKHVLVMPLPHPSPLNRRWLPRFPAMLRARLAQVPSR